MQHTNYDSFAKALFGTYDTFRVSGFASRHFSPEMYHAIIEKIVSSSSRQISIKEVGRSFEGRPLHLVTLGKGSIAVLLWSQMHGDESTATMAIADILNYFTRTSAEESTQSMLSSLTLHFLPMLNPDGVARRQRRTAQNIDMNRDALALVTPEAQILKQIQNNLQPQFGFNLHDQELSTVGTSKELTAIALLAPAFNPEKSDNEVRRKAKHVAAVFATTMSQIIPGKIARYDDTFEPRAFGDTMQAWRTSTVLVESGHARNDPQKEVIRKLNVVGILSSLSSVATGEYQGSDISLYEQLPFNGKKAYDVVVRNILVGHGDGRIMPVDIAISYQVDTHAESTPKLVDLGDLSTYIGLQEKDGKRKKISHSLLTLGQLFEWEKYF